MWILQPRFATADAFLGFKSKFIGVWPLCALDFIYFYATVDGCYVVTTDHQFY